MSEKSKSEEQVPITRLEELRNDWGVQVRGIENIYGSDDPAVKAFRVCIGDLYRLIHPSEF